MLTVDKTDWDDLANYRDSLEHYGRKGMEWYKHKFGRYQNGGKYADGRTSTKSGSKSKASDVAKKKASQQKAKADKKAAQEKAKAEKKATQEKERAEKEAKKKEARRKDILSNPTKLYKHRKEFTYDEIKKAMETFEWEKRLNTYSSERLKSGAEFIKTMTTYVNNGINLYNSAARILNTMSAAKGEDAKLRYVDPSVNIKKDDDKEKKKKQQSS